MKYQLTFQEFVTKISEAINYEKIQGLQVKLKNLTNKLGITTEYEERKQLQKDIKICELKLMVAKMGG